MFSLADLPGQFIFISRMWTWLNQAVHGGEADSQSLCPASSHRQSRRPTPLTSLLQKEQERPKARWGKGPLWGKRGGWLPSRTTVCLVRRVCSTHVVYKCCSLDYVSDLRPRTTHIGGFLQSQLPLSSFSDQNPAISLFE